MKWPVESDFYFLAKRLKMMQFVSRIKGNYTRGNKFVKSFKLNKISIKIIKGKNN